MPAAPSPCACDPFSRRAARPRQPGRPGEALGQARGFGPSAVSACASLRASVNQECCANVLAPGRCEETTQGSPTCVCSEPVHGSPHPLAGPRPGWQPRARRTPATWRPPHLARSVRCGPGRAHLRLAWKVAQDKTKKKLSKNASQERGGANWLKSLASRHSCARRLPRRSCGALGWHLGNSSEPGAAAASPTAAAAAPASTHSRRQLLRSQRGSVENGPSQHCSEASVTTREAHLRGEQRLGSPGRWQS